MLNVFNTQLKNFFLLNSNRNKCNLFFRLFYLTIFLVPQIFIKIIENFKKIINGDSFYAESLRLHYLRTCNVAFGKDLYLNEIGKITSEQFIYQSFLAIKICYQFIGRPLFVFIGHMFLIIYLFNVFPLKEALILNFIFISSSVFYFNQIERGNYQFLGLILSLIAVHYYFTSGLNIEFLLLYLFSIIFSISSFILLSLVIGINLLIDNSWYEFFFVFFFGCLILILFLLSNSFYLKFKNKDFDFKFMPSAIVNLFTLIGLIRNKKKNTSNLSRKKSYLRGFISIVPFLLAAIIEEKILSTTYFLLIIIIFLNQSKILRVFDYYFIYTWSFYFFLLFFQGGDWMEIVALIIIGTNPIYVYAMDNYNFSSERGFKIMSPIFITKRKRNEILNQLLRILPKGSLVIIPIKKTLKEYNDLWKIESLILEWIWTAAENKKIKFYPDWFSIFNVFNQKFGFHKIGKLKKINNVNKASFEMINTKKVGKKDKAVKLSKIFNNEILVRYTIKIKDYFLLIE